MARLNSPAELEKFKQEILSKRDPNKPRVSVCAGSGCVASGANEVIAAFKAEIAKQGLATEVGFRGTGCHGFCEKGPIVVISPDEICYVTVKVEDVPEIVEKTLQGKEILERLLYVDPTTGEKITYEHDIPFYKHQQRMIFGANRITDPKNIEDYIANGGYQAMAKALFEMTPEQVIAEVKASGLRGRGGGGFPTGMKWEFARNSKSDQKYVIVNCDEGDPGAYMDRSLMEGNPNCVFEGLMIGAYAIGANEGHIYVRQEYPLALENMFVAIEQAEALGLLGDNIMGSGFNFHIKVARGAGAFVCGEETALLASLEGKPGEPRPRPPFPAVKGLFGKPTNINNVETWGNIPLIINKGAAAFAAIGTEGSKGTKIFSLVGKINNTGLVEVPMGISLRDIVFKIGGGVSGGHTFKAMQTGGPSGGCIPEHMLDLKVGFDELTKAGAMMGSGGMIVVDENTCMVDFARYFLNFLVEESCGKCVACREGLRQMRKIMTNITEGNGKPGDVELLQELAELANNASLCALGKTSANPLLSTIRYFRDEYDAHVNEKRCPALLCKALINYYIDPEKCQGCQICLKKCAVNAISGGKSLISIIDQEKCTKCGNCLDVCPPKFGAVKKISGEPVPPPVPEDQRTVTRKSKEK